MRYINKCFIVVGRDKLWTDNSYTSYSVPYESDDETPVAEER